VRRLLVPVLALVMILSGVQVAQAAPDPLRTYAKDTWKSLVAMTDPATGLVADNIPGDLSAPDAYTSPTNIGGYMWSALVAQKLGIISSREATQRVEDRG